MDEDIRKEFKILNNNDNFTYFDNSSTSLKPNCVLNEIEDKYLVFLSIFNAWVIIQANTINPTTKNRIAGSNSLINLKII